jgi:hypothetical protein
VKEISKDRSPVGAQLAGDGIASVYLNNRVDIIASKLCSYR